MLRDIEYRIAYQIGRGWAIYRNDALFARRLPLATAVTVARHLAARDARRSRPIAKITITSFNALPALLRTLSRPANSDRRDAALRRIFSLDPIR